MDCDIKHSGISNPGNQCYFNSMMQALASCLSVYTIAKSRKDADDTILKVIKKYNLVDIQLEELQVEDDEALAEELTRRVAARLVAEMKKAKKGMTEGGSWGAPPKTKGKAAPKGHGPSKKPFGAKGKGR